MDEALRRERALITLDMYESVLRTLHALGQYRRMLTAAAGVGEDSWPPVSYEEREAVIAAGRAALDPRRRVLTARVAEDAAVLG